MTCNKKSHTGMTTYQPIDTRHMQVGGWIGQRMNLTWKENLLALNWDEDFLQPFLEKQGKGGEYVGMGKTLDGLVRFAYHTNEPELLALRRHVVDTLIGSQDANGYLGTYQAEKRILLTWDVHEQAYVVFALVSDWHLFHEKPSLEAAIRLGDYLVRELSDIPLPTVYNEGTKSDLALELTMLGLDRALLALYRATQDRRYLDFCLGKLNLTKWDLPIVEGRHTKIEGHAYAYFTRCLAQLELIGIAGGEEELITQTRRVLEYLRQRNGLVVTGTCSHSECWHSDQDGTGDLGETCATAYWIRLCARLLCLKGSGEYGDLMERAIYNALFAAQSPDGRRLRYYTPFEGKRKYWDGDTYCCPGNFRRIMSELPEFIYFTNSSGFLVNLYTDSQATIPLDSGLTVEVVQKTDYPNSGRISLSVTPSRPARFEIRLRIPSWCRLFTAEVNADKVQAPVQDGLLRIDREWKAGDLIELVLEMPWRLVRGVARQSARAAVMRGPVLYCHNPTRNPRESTLIVDPVSFKPPVADETIRPHGLVCRQEHGAQSDLLTEFADPGGEETYFIPANADLPVADELLKP